MASTGKNKFYLGLLVFLFLANIIAWFFLFSFYTGNLAKVDFFDVGQGDAILIQTPKRTQILIDGGPSSRIIEKLADHLPFYDRSLDVIISTHPDLDHLSGLVEVVKKYKVGLVGSNGTNSLQPEFREWDAEISKNKIPLVVLKKGDRLRIGDDVIFDVLAPLEDFSGKQVADSNTSSIVIKMEYGKNSFLFTGDAPKSIENVLVNSGTDLASDVLKPGHHGSKTSTGEIFLQKVNPKIAVVSAGLNNRYGHPHQEILDRLSKYGIKIFRTDNQGDIEIASDGRELSIKTDK